MKNEAVDFLERYVNTISPSGFEDKAAKMWKEEARGFADEVKGDLHGNSFAVVNKGGTPRVMLAGHTDEIGLMVSQISEGGYLFFNTIGGWDSQVLPGQRVRIRGKEKEVIGVIGRKPIHLLEEEERKEVVKPEDLWIDIGVEGEDEARELVEIGSPGVLDYSFQRLQGDLAAARGFDDKSGGFVVLEAARELAKSNPQAEIHAVATVQEEIGLRGAQTSAFGIDPDIGIAVDVSHATDTPSMKKEKRKVGEADMNEGPILSRGPNINPVLLKKMVDVAESDDIPYQMAGAPGGTGTDANAIQLTRGGVATGLVSIPNRYMHSPCEVVSMNDLGNIIKLISSTVEQIKGENFEPF
ncbi:M42 family metallopeptidase [Candidatus Bipolaricaulota bacterium]|nr:M42 family metallopeptidase [Candidatus Bipolaricaulota bacterium]